MTAKKVRREWLMNCRADVPDKKALAFRKGFMKRLFNDQLLEVGKPKATSVYTSKELEKMGLVGLYGYRFIRPIMDYKKHGELSANKSL